MKENVDFISNYFICFQISLAIHIFVYFINLVIREIYIFSSSLHKEDMDFVQLFFLISYYIFIHDHNGFLNVTKVFTGDVHYDHPGFESVDL